MMAQGDGTLNITRTIDERGFGPYQIRIIVLCALVAFLDGVDSQSIAIAAPIIADALNISRAALGPVFSAALLGAMLGALSFGTLGDRFGRKRMLAIAAVLFGTFTIATAYVTSYESLIAIRFLAGIGLGGATPCFISLATEYAPKRRRAMIASLIWAAFPLGGTLGGFFNAFLITKFGWQTIFLVGGVLPLVVAAALLVWLPESIRFLLAKGRDEGEIRRIASRLVGSPALQARIVADEERIEGVPLKHLFSEGRALGTVLLWVPFFMAFGILGIAVLWTPILLRDNGIPPSQAALVLGFHGMGSLVGMACAGRLMERFGALAVLVPALLLGAVATGTLGYAATSVLSMSVALVAIGLFVGLGASGSIALAAVTYPTAIRSSGIGWAMGMGRFGQVLAPLFTSLMVGFGWKSTEVFLVFALAPFIGAIAVVLLRWQGSRTGAQDAGLVRT